MAERKIEAVLLDTAGESYSAMLSQAFPQIQFHVCRDYNALLPVLADRAPEIALTFKIGTSKFPRVPLLDSRSIRWVHTGGAGIDHLQPWDTGRLVVTNSSGIHGDAMSQYVLAAVLNVNQNNPVYARQQVERIWKKHECRSVDGQTMTVVGYGSVGSAIGNLAQKVGMKVIGVRSRPERQSGPTEVVGLGRLHWAVSQADHLVISLPLTEETRGMIDADVIAAVKPGSHFVNVARGGIVDEAVLLGAIGDGRIAHATMDVFATEPLNTDSPFWSLPNVTLTPHSSSDVAGWRMRVVKLFEENLRNWLEGRELRNVVDPVRGY